MLFLYSRYSLAFLAVGRITDGESLVYGSSFHDGFNVGIGVFGTDNLTLKNNVIHHTVGPAIDLGGQNNKLLHNLVTMSLAEATFKVRNYCFL